MTATKTNPIALAAFSELVRRLGRRGHQIVARDSAATVVMMLPAPEGVHGELLGELEWVVHLRGWDIWLEAGDCEMCESLTADNLAVRMDRMIQRARRAQYC
jgi:hypothetical protein